MSPDYIRAAEIEVKLLREHLAPPDVRPALEDATWVADVPCGPDPEGIRRLQALQHDYGYSHVTTGNASAGTKGQMCGVYVRDDVVEDRSPNFLREYLSRDD